MKNFLFNIKTLIKIYISSNPLLVSLYLNFFAKERIVTGKEDILISGPPRVSNTFVGRMIMFNQENLTLVNHFHSPGQVINAIKKGVPAIIIIRDPIDMATSLCIKYPMIHPFVALQTYIVYYKNLLKYRDKFLLIDFETIKSDFNEIITQFNVKYKDIFQLEFINDLKEHERYVLDSMNKFGLPEGNIEIQSSGPTNKKEKMKKKYKSFVKQQVNTKNTIRIYNELKRSIK